MNIIDRFLQSIHTHDHILDLQKLGTKASFPVYVLVDDNFVLQHVQVIMRIDDDLKSGCDFAEISPLFFYPTFTLRAQTLFLCHFVQDLSNMSTASESRAYLRMRRFRQFMPPDMEYPVDLSNRERSYNFLSSANWQPFTASNLEFNLVHFEKPQPLSFAFSYTSNNLGVVALASGVPKMTFLTLLEKLIPLQQADNELIAKLQEQMRGADEEVTQFLIRVASSKPGADI